ncbi:MAG: GNAT family N-acetyltransferase [Paracoccaceae bacterium]
MLENTLKRGENRSALDANLVNFWSLYGQAPGCSLQTAPGAMGYVTGIPHPMYNGAIVWRDPGEALDEFYQGLRRARFGTTVPALWWLGPSAQSTALCDRLAGMGLTEVGQSPGMVAEIGKLEEPPRVRGLHITEARTEEERRIWGLLAAEASGHTHTGIVSLGRIEQSLTGMTPEEHTRYLAMQGGAPVAAAARVISDGLVGIYALAVLPEMRRMHIGSALTWALMTHGAAKGQRWAAAHATSAAGLALFTKMGFAEICHYRHFSQS